VLDYYQILDAGETHYKVGDIVEEEEVRKENASAVAKKKRPCEVEPYCFYLSAWEEDKYTIAQANVRLSASGQITSERVEARRAGNPVLELRTRSTTSTSAPSSSSPWRPRWCRSSRTTMRTAP